MQFIRNFVSDIRKCVRIVARFCKWWKRSSNFARCVASALLAALLIPFFCFVGFETSNVVSASLRHSAQLKKINLSEREKIDCKISKLNGNDKSFIKKYCKNYLKNKSLLKPNFWKYPTGGAYPNLTGIKVSDLHVNVNLKKQRVYIIAHGKTVYSMVMSSGIKDSTPHGNYQINGRGDHFFNQDEKVGADYWVAFIGSQYLFHSVPTNYNFGEYIPSEGMKLGKPASHGCVRLSVADAKWFYKNIPDGTAVHIG